MPEQVKLIAITGGIGSGKSVVSQILRKLGFPVYDSDTEARQLMDNSIIIKNEIREKIDSAVIEKDGSINRKKLSEIVFNNAAKLNTLNHIVHSAVRNDLQQYVKGCNCPVVFVETAILYQSEIDRMVYAVWDVYAPVDVRIKRVMKRNSLTAEEVKKRIKSQEFMPEQVHKRTMIIINDDKTAILPQIETFLSDITPCPSDTTL
ncbi:MAG: dephospho-CoA kinase [Muribaculaceae bacterium]|nr:dephospho-CoA kinase [Muribaculaceae bacterium]